MQTAEALLQEISVIYKDKNAAPAKSNEVVSAQTSYAEAKEPEATEISLERRLIHDISNGLASVMGFSQLLLTDAAYGGLLGKEYGGFKEHLELINSSTTKMVAQLNNLGGFYRVQEQKVEPVPASTLGNEAITYLIVHIDDQKESRDAVYRALSSSSNIIPLEGGVFGHEGRKVRYTVVSYSTVKEALKILNIGKEDPAKIDLLITDREMPEQDGYALLNLLNQPKKQRQRRSKYANVGNIAMLTGGITEQDAIRTRETYGIPVFTKPFQPLQLEQQVYNAINQKK